MSGWVQRAALFGGAYVLLGDTASALAAAQGRAGWRLVAWVGSALLFASHLALEQRRANATVTALRVSSAVAIGAFALAAVATVRAVTTGTGNTLRLVISLLAWPAITAVPAYVVALAIASILSRFRRNRAPGRVE